ncbi:MAG: Do family serine endopeptidase [Leptothrix ochracea]|uniref:Do family serine endopeptidase n=1 Tax=Leptothrix ochracea TaxID=735331 RepID=UPI0034E1F038
MRVPHLSMPTSPARRWLFAGAALVCTGALLTPLLSHHTATAAGGPSASTVSTSGGGSAPLLVKGLPDFTELVEVVGPSVVNIRTRAKVQTQHGGNPEMDEEMQELFRRFFGAPPGQPGSPGQRRGRPESQPESVPRGVGSGFVMSADGYVMTNAHVVDGADEIVVRLNDKRELKARLVGADKRTDVALLKIEATGLSAVRFGEVSRLKVGEWVIAIGSPFDLDNTVTAGIVSAKARDTGEMLPFIQTDVAINPGNSGGPLINMRGEVVGINSQIYSRSGGYMGISFAIPIDEAARVVDQLRTRGHVVRGRIGVQIGEVSTDVAETLGLPKGTGGALVRSVEIGSPADKAGIEAGDIVMRFGDKPVEKWNDLPRLVGNTAPGTSAQVQVLRRGKTHDLKLHVAEMDAEDQAQPTPDQPTPAGETGAIAKALGLSLSNLNEAQRKELKLRGGVRITQAQGAAARAGLREDDILLSVADVEVRDTAQLETLLSKVDRRKPLQVLYRRGVWAQYAVIRAEP